MSVEGDGWPGEGAMVEDSERRKRGTAGPVTRSAGAVAALAVLVAACGGAGPDGAGQASAGADAAPDSTFFAERWAGYTEALTSGDAGRAADHFTEGARLMEPGLATIRGRRTIRSAITSALDRVEVAEAEMRTREVHRHGTRAYEIGEYREEIRPEEGAPRRNRGRYVAFWVRDDGEWRVSRLLFNQLPTGRGAAPDTGSAAGPTR
jgi:ketosteroid isomerase-like protein